MRSGLCLLGLVFAASVLAEPFFVRQVKTKERIRQIRESRNDGPVPPANWFSQSLDHFNALNNGVWQQRYYVNSTFWKSFSSPVFLYIEGEGSASPMDVVEGEHVELAQQYGALIVALEHRYYGASNPTADMSTENMQWLSSDQAMADLAAFADWFGNAFEVNPSTPWICFGGSYPGALSAWFRLKYPQVVYGAISSSSPVWAVEDFTGYNDVVQASLSNPLVGGSPACLQAVQQAFDLFESSVSNPAQWPSISDYMGSCDVIANWNDAANFASNIAGNIMESVQYNNEGFFMNVQEMCEIMLMPASSPLVNLRNLTLAWQLQQGEGDCVNNSYALMMQQMNNITNNPSASGVGIRQWTWQTCVQFGYYQTCEAGTSCPFSTLMTLSFSLGVCEQAFGISSSETASRIAFTNVNYGGNSTSGTNIVFVNGLIDPWHYLSIRTPTNSMVQTVVIPNTAHCANMMPSSPNDPPQLIAARQQVSQQVGVWLQQANAERSA